MRVLLINPPLNTSLPAAGAYPMGLAYIAAVLRQNHCDVEILDIRLNEYDRSYVSNWLLRNSGRFDLYGIGGMVTAYSYIQWLSREIRKASPSSMIVAGGSICTAGELLLQKSEVDLVCIGNGEKTAQSLVDALRRHEDLATIPNALVKRGGSILRTGQEELMVLDAVPFPAWELLDMDKYTATSYLVPVSVRSITMITGRGCPYSCSFCYRNFGRRLRHRSVENVVREMREVVDRYGIGHIDFLDEIFNADRDYVTELCRRIIEERFRLSWRCTGRANLVDRELLQLMYEAGCRWIGYGIESGSQKMLDGMGKRQRVEDVERSIRLARDAGMIVTGTFILGLPGETEQTIQETEQFFVRNRIFNVPFFPVPYPGTHLFDECREKNRLSFDEAFINSLEKDATELIVNLSELPDVRLVQKREELIRKYSSLIPPMQLQGGLYTVNVDAHVDDAIEKDLGIIVDRLKTHRAVKSIVLGGGFGRGEGSVLVDENGFRPVNDYDIFVVVSDEDSTDYRPVGTELARELNVRWVDIIPIKFSSIATLPPSQFHYDLKYGSRHLWGEYVLDRIPTYPEGRVDGESINTLLLNRLVCALEAYSEEFERRPLTPQEAFFLINQTGKVVSACVECLLMKDGQYHPSYRTRHERFQRIFSSEFSLVQLNETATQFKLRPSRSLVTDPVIYWKNAIKEYVRLLASFLVADSSPSIPALVEAVLHKRTTANPIERAEILLLLSRARPEVEQSPILAAVRRELEHLSGMPVWKSDWEGLRAETIDLWHRMSHGENEMKRQGKEVVLMILIDGLRHDYINPNNAPFLHALGEQNIEGRVRETFAFELRPAFFAGLHPDECDVANMYCYSPASSPFAEIDLSSGQRDVINRLLRDLATQKGYTLVKHVGGSAEIPLRLLKYFDFSEKYNTADPSSIPGRKTVFDLLRERNKRFLWIGYPDGPGTTRDVKDLLMSRLTEDVDFIYLHFSELDWVGHEFGPHTERQRIVLKEIDNAVREVFVRLNRTFDRLRFIVFGDHGQVAITQQIDLQSRLDRSGLSLEKDYLYFLDSTQARFWFFNDRARDVITEILLGVPEGKILSRDDLKSLHFDFDHNRFGDLIFVMHEGVGIFPNFFQATNPCKGLHGFLPEVESNWAAIIVGGCGIRFRVDCVVEMVDLFPTLLQLLGLGQSPHPTAGISLLERYGLEIQDTRYRATLVMPTYNRLEILKKSLQAIEDQTLSKDEYELIVVDDGSTDGTLEYLEKYSKQTPLHFTVMRQDHAGPAAARNKGILAASGKIIIFVGDDMIPSENFISNHLYFHDENPRLADACLGFIDWSKDIEINPLMEHVTSIEGGQQFNYGILHGPMPDGIEGDVFWFFWSSNLSVKRAFLLTHGIFNEKVFKHAMWEDIELGYRLQKAGMKLHYKKGCTVYHDHQLTLKSFAERQRMVGWYAHDAGRLGIPIEEFKKGQTQIYSMSILDALVSSLSGIRKGRFSRSAMARIYNYCLAYAARLGYRERMSALDTDADVVASLLFNAFEENVPHQPGCADAGSFSAPLKAQAASTAVRSCVPETGTGDVRRQTVEAHEGILKLLVAAGKRAEAGFALEKLVESYPGYPPAYNDLGVLYGESGEVSKALAAYEKAVSLDPENATFRKNLADHLYVAMKQPEKAVLQYEQALQLNPQDIETLLILGNLRVESGHFREARELYLRALELDSSNELAGRMFDALDTDAAAAGETDSATLYRKARSLVQRGRTDQAIVSLEELLQTCPDHAEAHNDLGILYFGKGNREKALVHYEKAVAIDPTNRTALKNLADLYWTVSERTEDALRLYNSVLTLDPDDVEALSAVGSICIRLGRLEDAHPFFERILRVEPANAAAREILGKLNKPMRAASDAGRDATQTHVARAAVREPQETHRTPAVLPEGVVCLQPFYMMEFTTSGHVYTCCPAWTKLSIGHIGKATIADIWNSDQARLLRRKILSGQFQDVCNEICPHIAKYRHTGKLIPWKDLDRMDTLTPELAAEIRAGCDFITSPPTVFNLSNSTVCNLSCIMCSRHTDASDPALIRKTAEELVPYLPNARRIVLSGMGDPFARPDTRRIMLDLAGKGPVIDLITNGLLIPRYWNDIAECRFGNLLISVDAADRVTYEKIRRGGSWTDLLASLSLVRENRHRFQSVALNMTVMRENASAIPAFIDFAESYGFHASFQRIRGNHGDQNIFEMNDTDILRGLSRTITGQKNLKRRISVYWGDLLEYAKEEPTEAALPRSDKITVSGSLNPEHSSPEPDFKVKLSSLKELNKQGNSLECRKQAPIMKTGPLTVIVSVGSKCNLRCLMCYRTIHKTKREYMPWATFEKAIEIFPTLQRVKLIGAGEPFLNRDYFKMLDVVKRFDLETETVSNGTLITDEMAKRIVLSGLDSLCISMDGATSETYEFIRRGGSFRKTIEGIERINHYKKEFRSKTPVLGFSTVAMRRNVEELPAIIELAGRLSLSWVTVLYMTVFSPELIPESLFFHQELSDRMLSAARTRAKEMGIGIDMPGLFRDIPAQPRPGRQKKCFEPWQMAVIETGGEVFPCCTYGLSLGNLNENDFYDIWNNEAYQDLRRRVNSDDPPEPCKHCSNSTVAHSVQDIRSHIRCPIPPEFDEKAQILQSAGTPPDRRACIGSTRQAVPAPADTGGADLLQHARYVEALACAADGRSEDAIQNLTVLLKDHPNHAQIYNDIGVLHYSRQEKDLAFAYFEKAVSLAPDNTTFLKNLADFNYAELKRTGEAVSLYEKYIALNPRDSETLFILGNVAVEQSRFDRALDYFQKALIVDPSNDLARKAVDQMQGLSTPVTSSDQDTTNSIRRNKAQWSNYEWPEGGDEWSAAWGGTENLWHRTIFPRIRPFLPSGHILEIAPGYGRCTQFLVTQCRQLTLVDLTEKCIEACRQRFKAHEHIRYCVNDGKSLDMVEDGSVDFAFSWDSLVHVEHDVMQAYLGQLASKLKPGGVCFLHHSNIGAFRDAATGRLTVENRHWRGESMSAGLFRAYCREADLRCLSQEIVAWGGDVLNDCFSILVKGDDAALREPLVVENPSFMHETTGRGKPPELYQVLGASLKKPVSGDPDVLRAEARRFIDDSKFSEAAEILKTYLQARPDDALAHNDLGCLYYRQGEKDKALTHYEKAVEIEPGNATYLKNLADFYHVEQGRTDDALRIYHRILADHPGDVETLLALGHVSIAVARLDDARTFFERAIASDPVNETARTLLEQLQRQDAPVQTSDSREGQTSVSIIIPAGDDPEILSRCIGTILQNTEGTDYEIVLTSGLAPASGEESLVGTGEKKIRLTAVPVNGNPVAALNAAVRKTSGRSLVFMDPRLLLSRGWLEPLLKVAEANLLSGAISPKIGIPPDTLLEAGFTTLSGGCVKGNGEGAKIDDPRYNYLCETPVGSRFTILVPKEIWDRCGGFDEQLTDFGMALMDLSLSIRQIGMRLFYQPLSAVGFVDHPYPGAPGKLPPPADSGLLGKLRPVTVPHGRLEGTEREGKSVLVIGVYLTDRFNTAEDIVAVLSGSKTCRVTQRWVALGDTPPGLALTSVTVRTIREKTPKFRIVNDLLAAEDLSRYDYVLLTDDDVVMPDGFLDAFIGLQEKLGFAIAQPARTSNSYIDHPIVEQANGLLARETRFVEIGPVVSFHRSAYDVVFPFDLASPMGWGYENVWSLRLGERGLKMGILDATPVDHSIRKPVENYDWSTADRQRTDFLDRNAHLPIDSCFTTVQAIRLEGEPG